jgi:fructose/tagatose bisphosphate aldolase
LPLEKPKAIVAIGQGDLEKEKMMYRDEKELLGDSLIEVGEGKPEFKDLELFRNKIADNLADTLILSHSLHLKKLCYWLASEAAYKFGIFPASILHLYEARAKEGFTHFTVPAINLRTLTYDSARAAFRAVKKINAGSFIFEIARSEIGYTEQRPREYASCLLLAAIREGFRGPLFIQGDHFQANAKNFLADRDKEVNQLKGLISEAIDAGFYNIDIDSSTLVDLTKSDIDEQQKSNYELCALLTKHIRSLQPEGIEVSVGGEIGEVGGKNSTPQELRKFMEGYTSRIRGIKGISKISIQTGTSHGGVVLPDGSMAEVQLDLDTLKRLSQVARTEFGLAGAVQHGASTLPKEAFHHFPEFECAEIHLATQFQNFVYDYFPSSLKEKIYTWLHKNHRNEKKPDQTDAQFIYKTRKKALGPFKEEIYTLPFDLKNTIALRLEEEFSFLFEQLNIKDTKLLVDKYIRPVKVKKKREDF